MLGIRNLYTCESHNELIRTYLETYCDGKLDNSIQPYQDMILKLQRGEILE